MPSAIMLVITWHYIGYIWGRNERVITCQVTFSNAFPCRKICILISISLSLVSNGPINNKPSLLKIMAWRLANILTNDEVLYWQVYGSFGLNELISPKFILIYGWCQITNNDSKCKSISDLPQNSSADFSYKEVIRFITGDKVVKLICLS